MLEKIFIDELWIAVCVWIILYASDYYLTILSSRLYRARLPESLPLTESIELTPYFQKDIDAGRILSVRLLGAAAASTASIVLLWVLTEHGFAAREWYSLGIGSLFLRLAVANMRHVNNIFLSYRQRTASEEMSDSESWESAVFYPRSLVLASSALDRLAFATLFLFLWSVTGSWFILGGAVGCSALSGKQLLSSRRCA